MTTVLPEPCAPGTNYNYVKGTPVAWGGVKDVYCKISFCMRSDDRGKFMTAAHFSKHNNEKSCSLGSVFTMTKLRQELTKIYGLSQELNSVHIDLPKDAFLIIEIGKPGQPPRYRKAFTRNFANVDPEGDYPTWNEAAYAGDIDIRDPKKWKAKGYQAMLWFVLPKANCELFDPKKVKFT